MKILSVAELTESIKTLLEETYPEVWVAGEISNFTAHHSGHFYFNLKDESARISMVMFRGSNHALRFEPADGMAVVCYGRVTVYSPRGNYQIIVEQMEPQGLGVLQLAFEQLKEKLAKEGLFDEERKRPLPFLPQRIGVITSRSGAALRDILHVLERRFPNLAILVHPVAVQGEEAAPQIAAAIETMNHHEDLELLIVARGGGSIEDLWAFNEEVVARAIAGSRLPVITGVGHETDFTIADFVADVRAPTPSAAAEMAVPRQEDLRDDLDHWNERLLQSMMSLFRQKSDGLRMWRHRLIDPRRRLDEVTQRVDEMRERAFRALRHRLHAFQLQSDALTKSLRNLNPLAILDRGYCVATPAGSTHPLTAATQVKIGDAVELRLAKGKVGATVSAKS